jgi:hypothetical protein
LLPSIKFFLRGIFFFFKCHTTPTRLELTASCCNLLPREVRICVNLASKLRYCVVSVSFSSLVRSSSRSSLCTGSPLSSFESTPLGVEWPFRGRSTLRRPSPDDLRSLTGEVEEESDDLWVDMSREGVSCLYLSQHVMQASQISTTMATNTRVFPKRSECLSRYFQLS